MANRKRRPKAEMFSAWLARSGVCLLSIDLRLFRRADVDTMVSLIPYSHRWRNVELAMIDLDTFLEARLSPLVSLESLSLGPLGTEHNIIQLSSLLQSALQLRNIDWYCKADIRMLHLPWTRLHHHQPLWLSECLGILALWPHLLDVHIGQIIL